MTNLNTEETPAIGDHGGRQKGFTLLVALLVMALLTTLGLTLMFTSETERAISRNFSGTIQAGYAAEAVVDAMVQALLFDLKNDNPSGAPIGWANKYLVVCDESNAATCLTKYGFNPTLAPCYDSGTPPNGCVFPDTGGTLTGSSSNWVADLTWRPSGVRPTFPSLIPVRLHPDLQAVMPWWRKFVSPVDWKNPSDPDALNSGAAGIALTSNCVSGCAGGTPVFSVDEVFVTGMGRSATPLRARITKSKNPATRSVSVRVKGDLLSVWGHALVSGAGPDPSDQAKVIEGDYLVRGSTLHFNQDAGRVVMAFNAPNTGIVNNYYDDDSVPAIAGWWWRDARPCSTTVAGCDANNTNNNGANSDFDANSATQTLEPIYRHLPDPPDMDKSDSWPGGYRADAPYSANFPGPEGLDTKIRLRAGIIELGDAAAGLGRVETLEGAAAKPGHYWDNLKDVLMNDNPLQSPTEVAGANKDELYRNAASTFDIRTKTGAFDIDPEQIKFPNLTDRYTEPLTGEPYDTYYDFMRPATPSATHPGGWALNLSGIDGSTGVGRNVDNAGLAGGACWPRGTVGDISPEMGEISAALYLSWQNGRPQCKYEVNTGGATTCGKDTLGACPAAGYCIIEMQRIADIGINPNNPCATDDSIYPPTIQLKLYSRKTKTDFVADPTLNLDTSSSIDSPAGRAQSTMFDSFAYKLYVDVLGDLDICTPPTSRIYSNNLVGLPDVFDSSNPANNIPNVYPGTGSTSTTNCTMFDGPCFQERSTYMDVHIQLSDTPVWSGQNKINSFGGRWFSVRYRPPGDPNGAFTVLRDPRAGSTCGFGTASDFAFETEGGLPTNPFRFNSSNFPGSDLITQAPNYDRAQPISAEDTMFRNMPTGAFVIALHLPCTDDLSASNHNPYKCSKSDDGTYVAPSPSYPGFYTHLIAWAPKYSCWRTTIETWNSITDPLWMVDGHAPPSPAQAAGCADTDCGLNYISWFGQSLWMANWTTLWNSPKVIGKGTPDVPEPEDEPAVAPTFGGYRLMVPINVGSSNAPSPCDIGLDRRMETIANDCQAGAFRSCGIDNDGVACNGRQSDRSGCPGPNRTCLAGSSCMDEPDFVKAGYAYGGCTDIYSPLITDRVPELSPQTGTLWNRDTNSNRTQCTTWAACSNNCFYHGVDPDVISGWGSTYNRYRRPWPGWSSAAFLEGTGIVFTNDTIRIGAPKKTCDSPTCVDATPRADYNSLAPLSIAATTAGIGYFSDPVVYDGRLILYAGNETPTTTSKIFIHDNLVPRTKFGCSDFLSLLANGDTEIDMQMPFDGGVTDRHHMMSLFSLSQTMLRVTTPDTQDVSTELVGSWLANGADFGSHITSGKPVQIIGTPTISTDECDHPYLPGRPRVPERQYLSYVEDGTVGSGL